MTKKKADNKKDSKIKYSRKIGYLYNELIGNYCLVDSNKEFLMPL